MGSAQGGAPTAEAHCALYSGPFDRASLAWFEGVARSSAHAEDAAQAKDIADLIRFILEEEGHEHAA